MKKTILITGCSSGIGYCVAKALHQRGYRVFATARRRESVEMLLAEGLESFRLNLTDSNSIHFAFEEVMRRTNGELYALFNNGAYGLPGAVEDLNCARRASRFRSSTAPGNPYAPLLNNAYNSPLVRRMTSSKAK